jgi:hypothetical protein
MPKPLDGAEHYTDMAIIPMQMLTAPYVESAIPSSVKSKLSALYGSHYYTAQSIYPPYETRPRNYSFWVEDGLSAGGIEFDENVVGGPSINQPSFSPGVILWGAGKNGAGAGWISVSEEQNDAASTPLTSSSTTPPTLLALSSPHRPTSPFATFPPSTIPTGPSQIGFNSQSPPSPTSSSQVPPSTTAQLPYQDSTSCFPGTPSSKATGRCRTARRSTICITTT